MEQSTIRFKYKRLNDQTYTFIEASRTWPISVLKEHLARTEATPQTKVIIFHRNRVLLDGEVGDYIESDAEVEIQFLPNSTIATDQVNYLELPPHLEEGYTSSLPLEFSTTKVFIHDNSPNFEGSYSIVWTSLYARNDNKINTILFRGVSGEQIAEFNASLSRKCIAGDFSCGQVTVANDWNLGSGVKVFRRISSESPQTVRYRYDGIYKVVAYWHVDLEKDEPRQVEWRYLLTASAADHSSFEIPEDDKIGEIRGISVGNIWRNRNELSQHRFHTPPQQGISGKNHHYAYSIVVSKSIKYENIDDRDVIIYTGQNVVPIDGRTLVKGNEQLAKSCNALFNEDGAVAFDWRHGIPLRVFRKARRTRRVRYDGIYKVYGYWPDQEKSGSKIWQFLIVRDDKHHIEWSEDDDFTHSYKVSEVSDA